MNHWFKIKIVNTDEIMHFFHAQDTQKSSPLKHIAQYPICVFSKFVFLYLGHLAIGFLITGIFPRGGGGGGGVAL